LLTYLRFQIQREYLRGLQCWRKRPLEHPIQRQFSFAFMTSCLSRRRTPSRSEPWAIYRKLCRSVARATWLGCDVRGFHNNSPESCIYDEEPSLYATRTNLSLCTLHPVNSHIFNRGASLFRTSNLIFLSVLANITHSMDHYRSVLGAKGSPTNRKSPRCALRLFASNSDLETPTSVNVPQPTIPRSRWHCCCPLGTLTFTCHYRFPHHQLFFLSTRACTMAMIASPRKVSMARTEIQVKQSFLDMLKSITFFVFSFAPGEVVRGRGCPPGPVWSGFAWPTSSLEAVRTA